MRSCRPLPVLRERHRRHHLLVHEGQEGVVDLHVEAGIDDRPVLRAQRLGEREQEAFLVAVMLVLGSGSALAGATTGRKPVTPFVLGEPPP